MSGIEIYDKPVVEVICNDRMHACRCGLTPGHGGPHECVEPDPQCGGSWADHEDPDMAWVIRYPGVRAGGPNEGFGEDPDEPVAEPRTDPVTPPLNAPRGGIRFFPGPSLDSFRSPEPYVHKLPEDVYRLLPSDYEFDGLIIAGEWP